MSVISETDKSAYSKQIERIKEIFPLLNNDKLIEFTVEKNDGHIGKTIQEIFKIGGEGVKKAKNEFYKKYPGALISKQFNKGSIRFLWDIRYDASFNKNSNSIVRRDDDGNKIVLVAMPSLMITSEESHLYEDHDYFTKKAYDGDNLHRDEEWGTNPSILYDEKYTDGKIMTQHVLEAILNVWQIPLLGRHPYTNSEGNRCYYQGVSQYRLKKTKLSTTWRRKTSADHNGLYCFFQKKEDGSYSNSQWEPPNGWSSHVVE